MSGLEMLADSGPVAGLLGVLAVLARAMLGSLTATVGKVLAEVQQLRAELVAHVGQDEERHASVVTILQQRWASQPRA
jgi:hypothetical protein